MSELLSLLLPLKPLPASQPKAASWWGRAAHALLLRAIEQLDAPLAQRLHDQEGLHPFTVSNLLGQFTNGALKSDQIYALRLTTYQSQVSQRLLETLQPGATLAAGSRVEIDYIPFEVLDVQGTSSPFEEWIAQTTYAELSGDYLLAVKPPPRRIRLQFASPTTFKSDGQHLPLPLPRLVFGSLLERWNAYAPVAFPAEVRRYIETCLTLSRYDLRTRAVMVKEGVTRVGMVGWAEFSTLNYDRYWMSLIATLARFALFCGVGAGVSYGMGQCRWLETPTEAFES